MGHGFLIAAPNSGSGKTTIARGLMALFARKGYKVQPFKCGPDYIDTKFHAAVCGRPSINLDTFMATPEHVRELFDRYGKDADVCVVEGMMGLFDGYDRDKGSSAEIARVLDLPVVLVVDAKSAAYSMAPLIQGFINFRKDVHIFSTAWARQDISLCCSRCAMTWACIAMAIYPRKQNWSKAPATWDWISARSPKANSWLNYLKRM